MLSVLFRETDRAQRMKTTLSLLLLGIDDFRDLGLRNKDSDELFSLVVNGVSRQLRSYDLLGRIDEFDLLAILPGCSPEDAAKLAQRLRMNVFAKPFLIAHEAIHLSACFGIASSEGRSPVVVLREAERALQKARETGPGTILCFGSAANSQADSFDLDSPPGPPTR
jgi:two-component system, cell cycle response regulator